MRRNCKLFLLAQGKDIKWKPIGSLPKYKHQIKIDGNNTILDRNIQLFRSLNPFVIIHPEYSRDDVFIQYYSYDKPSDLLYGIIQTRKLFGWDANRIIILFGDVIFSRYAVSRIINDDKTLALYGRRQENFVTGKQQPEIFGLSVYRDLQYDVWTALYWLWRASVTYSYASTLWSFYHYVQDEYILEEFGDYTDDIDSVDEYNLFYEYLCGAVKYDDGKVQ